MLQMTMETLHCTKQPGKKQYCFSASVNFFLSYRHDLHLQTHIFEAVVGLTVIETKEIVF